MFVLAGLVALAEDLALEAIAFATSWEELGLFDAEALCDPPNGNSWGRSDDGIHCLFDTAVANIESCVGRRGRSAVLFAFVVGVIVMDVVLLAFVQRGG